MKPAAFAIPTLVAFAALVAIAAPAGSQSPAPAAAALCGGPGALPTPSFGGTTRATLGTAPVSLSNRWASAGKTTFSHIIEGRPGRVHVTLETCSTASGGETVAIYPATAAGQRMPRRPRVIFSIAVPRGNVRHATLTIPPSRTGSGTGSVHLAVVVENASGRFHQGAYRLTLTR
ncbi:MAG: hypothetical protein ACREB1_03845 [Sphingomicrobium sp.]